MNIIKLKRNLRQEALHHLRRNCPAGFAVFCLEALDQLKKIEPKEKNLMKRCNYCLIKKSLCKDLLKTFQAIYGESGTATCEDIQKNSPELWQRFLDWLSDNRR